MSTTEPQFLRRAGPSAEQWRNHKDTIVELYRDHTMKEVQDLMEERFSFHASKRMYDRKLKQWGVSKNMSRTQKREILDHLISTGAWTSGASPPLKRPLPIDPRDFAKVVRYVKSKPSGASAVDLQKLAAMKPSPNPGPDARPPETIHDHSWSLVPPQARVRSSSRSHSTYCILSSEDDLDSTDEALYHDCQCSRHVSHETEPEIPLLDDESYLSESSPPLTTCPIFSTPTQSSSFDMLRVINNMNAFFTTSSTSQRSRNPVRRITSSQPYPKFWTDLKHGIYLLKVKSPSLAWPAINKACDFAPKILRTATDFDALFLLQLFSTLSPINTKACPRLRTILLQYFSWLAQSVLRSTHPVATICHELQKDLNHDREVSEQALLCMRDMSSSQSIDADLDDLAFRSECELIALLRRASDRDAACIRARTLVHRTRVELSIYKKDNNTDPPIDHPRVRQARSAATQLAHIYMDQLENLHEAINLCFFVLTGNTLCFSETINGISLISQIIHDSKSVYAMEDLAKIYSELLGDPTQATIWLQRAVSLSTEIIGSAEEQVATAHVQEKLLKLQNASIGAGFDNMVI